MKKTRPLSLVSACVWLVLGHERQREGSKLLVFGKTVERAAK
jgi:hypothetical protein